MPTEYYKAKLDLKKYSKNTLDILSATTENYGVECKDTECSVDNTLKHLSQKPKCTSNITQLICDNLRGKFKNNGTVDKSTVDLSQTNNCNLFTGQNRLTVNTSGSGTGTVSSSPTGLQPSGNPGDFGLFYQGLDVVLTATPNQGSVFKGWSGGVTSTGQLTGTITMNTSKTVYATFSKIRF
jgi:hypothetical protein